MPSATRLVDIVRSAAACRQIVDTAVQHGLDVGTCLAGTRLSLEDLSSPGTEVHAAQELTLIRNVIAHLGDLPGLGMETGSRYSLADTGILGYALMASPTFGDAVQVACRYVALTASYLSLAGPEFNGSEATITFDDTHVPADLRQFLIERDFATLLMLLPLLLGNTAAPVVFRFEMADLALPERPVNLGNLTVTVEKTARNALSFPAHLATRPMPVADAQTAAICIRQCEELLNRRRLRRGFSAVVRSRMVQQSSGIPSMADIATEFCITERTLHRRLTAENTSYRALLDEVRSTLAAEMLDTGFTVEATARRLGYTETSAFTHAHTRWHGCPPSRRKR